MTAGGSSSPFARQLSTTVAWQFSRPERLNNKRLREPEPAREEIKGRL